MATSDYSYLQSAETQTSVVLQAKSFAGTTSVYSQPFEIGGVDLMGLAKTVAITTGVVDFNLDWQISHDGETWVDGVALEIGINAAGNTYEQIEVFPSWAYYARIKVTGQGSNGTIVLTLAVTVTRGL